MDFPPGGTKVLGQPQVQLWEDRAQSPVKGTMSQHRFYPIKMCLKKSVSGHLDAERQQCFAVFGVVQHLNMRLKRQIRRDKGHAKVPRSKQPEAVGFRNVSGEHHLKSQAEVSVEENLKSSFKNCCNGSGLLVLWDRVLRQYVGLRQ